MPRSSNAQLHFVGLNPQKNGRNVPQPNNDGGTEQLSKVVQITGRSPVLH